MRLRATVRHVTLLPAASVEIDEADGAFYVLYYDANGRYMTDTWHQTLDAAKARAQSEFRITDEDWVEVPAELTSTPASILVTLYPPMVPSRPCQFCLSLQGGSVFADFDVDPDGRVFAVRVSFDGYGCCDAPGDVGRMKVDDSDALRAMVNRGSIDAAAADILRTYFRENRDAFWSDALAKHGLLT